MNSMVCRKSIWVQTPVSEGEGDGVVMKGSGKGGEVTGMGLVDRRFLWSFQRYPFAVAMDLVKSLRTKSEVRPGQFAK